MARQTTLSDIEDLARRLCYEADPSAIWAVLDESERLFWRREAQKRLASP
jgi:hypothetical protein